MSRDVTFDEASMVKSWGSQQVENISTNTSEPLQQVDIDATPLIPAKYVSVTTTSEGVTSTREVTTEISNDSDDVYEEEHEVVEDTENTVTETIATSKPRRSIRKPGWMNDFIAYALPVVEEGIPNAYFEAIHSVEHQEWEAAMQDEMESLYKNGIWILTKLPNGKKAIGCKWVYAKKEGSQMNQVRYKARLVAKGYAQKEGIDYNEVFSPVVKHSSIRILLALVAQYDLDLVQLDVKTAFLHGDLEEEIYMTQTSGFKVAGREDCVCKLKKSLYGLK